jgi:hypothetical protein
MESAMMRWLWNRDPDLAAFERERSVHMEKWFAGFSGAWQPRGLNLLGFGEAGETVWAKDAAEGQWLALIPAMIRIEPVAGGDLDDVPQAREPRAVVAVFRWVGRSWVPDPRAIFNLAPAQVIGRSGGRWVIQQPP